MDLERYRGCLMGLATGDALGAAVQFRPAGSFLPVTDMIGGGPFGLQPGQWTGPTSMALCLAESLVSNDAFDRVDQLRRYVQWWREGHLSSTGHCFDIGRTTRLALEQFLRSGCPDCGIKDQLSAGSDSLVRLAPVVLYFGRRAGECVEACGASSLTTHARDVCVDACRFWGNMLWGAVNGEGREKLLAPMYAATPGDWLAHPLCPEIEQIALGSYKSKNPPEIESGRYVVEAIESALWAFYTTDSFRDGALLCANLGYEANTVTAIYGQLAGAFYGENAIPEPWRFVLALREKIELFSDQLHALSYAGGGKG